MLFSCEDCLEHSLVVVTDVGKHIKTAALCQDPLSLQNEHLRCNRGHSICSCVGLCQHSLRHALFLCCIAYTAAQVKHTQDLHAMFLKVSVLVKQTRTCNRLV